MSNSISVLIVGLGKYATQSDILIATSSASSTSALPTPATIRETVFASVAASRAAGYFVEDFEVNPSEPTASLASLRKVLEARKWDGLMIGFGLRGVQAHTTLFESVVNLCREVSPETRLLFTSAPDEVFHTIERNFAKGKGE